MPQRGVIGPTCPARRRAAVERVRDRLGVRKRRAPAGCSAGTGRPGRGRRLGCSLDRPGPGVLHSSAKLTAARLPGRRAAVNFSRPASTATPVQALAKPLKFRGSRGSKLGGRASRLDSEVDSEVDSGVGRRLLIGKPDSALG